MANADGKDLVKSPYDWIEKMEGKYTSLLPKGTVAKERFIKSAILAVSQSETLKKCSLTPEGRKSILVSIARAAELGLEVGPLLGQAWLIPYNETRRIKGQNEKVMICHFQVGYKGLIELALRSGKIKSIAAEIVYDKDFFEVELGMGRHLTHKPNFREDRGNPIAYYFLAELDGGAYQFSVMTKKDIEIHRNKYSKTFQKAKDDKDGIWVKEFDAMALKTVIIKGLKFCPKSIEVEEQIAKEEEEMRNVTEDYDFGSSDQTEEQQEESDQEVQDAPETGPEDPQKKEFPPKEFKF